MVPYVCRSVSAMSSVLINLACNPVPVNFGFDLSQCNTVILVVVTAILFSAQKEWLKEKKLTRNVILDLERRFVAVTAAVYQQP